VYNIVSEFAFIYYIESGFLCIIFAVRLLYCII